MNVNTFAGTAGRALGTAARYARQLNDQIDWAEVAEIVLQGIKVLIVLALLAGRATRRAWDALVPLSERMGRWYAARIAPSANTTEALAQPLPQPMAHPLMAIATELEALTRAELQALVGTRRKLSRQQLVAMALAC